MRTEVIIKSKLAHAAVADSSSQLSSLVVVFFFRFFYSTRLRIALHCQLYSTVRQLPFLILIFLFLVKRLETKVVVQVQKLASCRQSTHNSSFSFYFLFFFFLSKCDSRQFFLLICSFFFSFLSSRVSSRRILVSAAVPLDPPRPEPSASSGQISPLVAIITGALSALFLLGAVLSMALRLRCRGQGNFNLLSSLRMHSRSSRSSAASETTAVMPAGVSSNNCCGGSGTLTSTASNSRLTAGGGVEGGGTASSNGGHQHHCSSSSSSDTTALLLIKSQQLHKSITPTLLNAMDVATAASADDHNPDLILSNSSTNCYGTFLFGAFLLLGNCTFNLHFICS